VSLMPTERDRLNKAEFRAESAEATAREAVIALGVAGDRVRELEALINTPKTDDFFEAVRLEAAHQVERWGTAHDSGKEQQDWFWLIGYLAGKVLASAIKGDHEKALHHTVSSAAVLLNWHRQLSGESTAMRPGIEPPKDSP
jgi:hypothetical protein